MKKKILGIFVMTLLIATASTNLLTGSVKADWQQGDGHLMHYPQTPSEAGGGCCDIHCTMNADTNLKGWVADDWKCLKNGYVTNIHFWGAWRNDNNVNGHIEKFDISIRRWDWGGDAVGPVLWQQEFYPGDFDVQGPISCDSNWFYPFEDNLPGEDSNGNIVDAQTEYYQYNMNNINNPLLVEKDTSYWLCIGAYVQDPETCWGWRTTNVDYYSLLPRCKADTWDQSEVIDESGYVWYDMAFVIGGGCRSFTVGECDDFNTMYPPGGEPTDPGQNLLDWINAHYSIPGTRECDEDVIDKYWAHTFDFSCPSVNQIVDSATLRIKIRNKDDNDHLKIGCIDGAQDAWDFGCRLTDYMPVGETDIITIDLSTVPGLIDEMNDHGVLDVAVDDDSQVDCARLTICCEYRFNSILDVEGNLDLGRVTPGQKVTSELTIENIGEENSELNWQVIGHPEWGKWTFKPREGHNLKPEDGPVQVEVEVEAPDEKESEFDGDVKIINLDNPEDYEIVPVTLTTPKNKVNNYNFELLEFLETHPLINKIIQILLQI